MADESHNSLTSNSFGGEELPGRRAKKPRHKKNKEPPQPRVIEPQRPGKKRLRKMRHEQKELSKADFICVCANNALYTGSVHMNGLSSPESHRVQITTMSTFALDKPSDSVPTMDGNVKPVRSPITLIQVQPLLVLDINGILCHRNRRKQNSEATEATSYRESVAHLAGTPIIARTDLSDFLTFLDQHFCLAIWTSAKNKTATALVKALIPEEVARRLLFVWAQQNCTIDRSQAEEQVFVKDLAAVWEAYPLWNANNTLLMDDSPDKSAHMANAIHPLPLHGRLVLEDGQKSDEENQAQQRVWFEGLVHLWKGQPFVEDWHENERSSTQKSGQKAFLEDHPL